MLRLNELKLGMTRQIVKDILGEPEDVGGFSRKHPAYKVMKYGDVQIFFGPCYEDGLIYINRYDKDGEAIERILN